MNNYPTVSFLGIYEPFNALSHLIAAVVFLFVNFHLLFRERSSGIKKISLLIFSFCQVFLFFMSGIYHLISIESATAKLIFQRLDYAAIWLMIAGTFTPIHIILFQGFWAWGILLFIWIAAITGLIVKTIFFTSIPNWISISLYLGLGWVGLVTMWKTYHTYGPKITKWILFGGLAYTIGSIFELSEWPIVMHGIIGSHELFHIFIILGAFFHWFFIYKISLFVIVLNEHSNTKYQLKIK